MKVNELQIERGVAALKAGKPVIFPTDTVYGLGVAVGIAETPELLYRLKERDYGKPVAWLVGSPDDLTRYGRVVPEFAYTLARTLWPGPLTLIVKAGSEVPEAFRAADGTIAMRMPDNETALELIRRVGTPLATSSANLSGQKPPKTSAELDPGLCGKAEAVLTDGNEKSGVASTVIDCTNGHPIMVREGALSIAEIQALV